MNIGTQQYRQNLALLKGKPVIEVFKALKVVENIALLVWIEHFKLLPAQSSAFFRT